MNLSVWEYSSWKENCLWLGFLAAMASEWICLLVPSGDYVCQRYLQFRPVLTMRENNLPLSEGLFMCSYPSYTVNELSCVFHTYWALTLTDIITSGGAKTEFLDWAVPFHLNSRAWVPVPCLWSCPRGAHSHPQTTSAPSPGHWWATCLHSWKSLGIALGLKLLFS